MSDDITSEAQTIAVGQLRAFIERIERLEEEKKDHRRRYQGSLRGIEGLGF
ncbi:GapR family DNA-binding domain-containing protein [Brucella abortus]|uniref:GapR family DNA-binding domain-containing protein n=1 Tax=Brucella abortus TaxID=235 RepID=UPI000B0B15B5